MIERSLHRKAQEAKDQGLWQRVLTTGLNAHYRITKAFGLKDVVPDELRQPSAEEGATQWQMQIERLLRLGFHDALNMSEKEYRATLPAFEPQPKQFADRFDIPILVDPRVNLKRQLAAHKAVVDPSALSEKELTKFTFGEAIRADISQKPYQMWIRLNKEHVYRSQGDFDWDEQGLTVIECLAVIREIPDAFEQLGDFSLQALNSSMSQAEGSNYSLELTLKDGFGSKHMTLIKRYYSDFSSITRGKIS